MTDTGDLCGTLMGEAQQKAGQAGHGVLAFGGNRTSGARDVASALSALSAHGGTGRHDFESETFITHALRGEGFDASEDGTGRGTPLVPLAMRESGQGYWMQDEIAGTLRAEGEDRPSRPSHVIGVPVPMINMQGSKGNAVAQADGPSYTLNAMHGHDMHAVAVPVHRDLAPTLTSNYGKQPDSSDTNAGPMLIPMAVPDVAGTMKACKDSGGWSNSADHAAAGYMVPMAHAFDARQSDVLQYGDKTGPLDTDGHSVGVLAFSSKDHGADATADLAPTLRAMNHADSHANGGGQMAVAFQERGREHGRELEIGGDVAYALTAPNGGGRAQERNVMTPAMQVRRLTPRECERLQGFPDDYTAIPWRNKPASECPDGPRYKALGNSWAVPVVRWIGQRIDQGLSLRCAQKLC